MISSTYVRALVKATCAVGAVSTALMAMAVSALITTGLFRGTESTDRTRRLRSFAASLQPTLRTLMLSVSRYGMRRSRCTVCLCSVPQTMCIAGSVQGDSITCTFPSLYVRIASISFTSCADTLTSQGTLPVGWMAMCVYQLLSRSSAGGALIGPRCTVDSDTQWGIARWW